MKRKISISIDDELIGRMQAKLKEGLFRSQSHLMEYATKKFLEGMR